MWHLYVSEIINFAKPRRVMVGDLTSSKLGHFHVPRSNATTLEPTLREPIDKAATVVTDEKDGEMTKLPVHRPSCAAPMRTGPKRSAQERSRAR